jgi:hypothetical protein
MGGGLGMSNLTTECFSVVCCERALEDKETNLWTLLSLLDGITTSEFGGVAPFETVAFWSISKADQGRKYWEKLVVAGSDGSRLESREQQQEFPSTPRLRQRIKGLMLPTKPGTFSVEVRWRFDEESEWHRSCHGWPIEIKEKASGADLPESHES